ncbi:TlpA family protein disulfide reductase [Aquabacterium sp.]|uniref:TlpA family protein disulfide reductase n=1 Tax=Aquabacterium sp. TaxID=1872578 RepID=UPI002C5CE876|nr:TlpA disulfide reductase family protein [Aquabacterium sp.]HSW07778.1 TlpA disulfide reductase family protein [Aquabacterium sp.]
MKLSRRHLATAAALVAVSAGIGVWLATGAARAVAPAVDYTVLDGTRLNLAQLKGKVVLINFWATSCTTCVHEMPQVVATYEKYRKRGYDTLAVAMEYDAPAAVADFAESRKLPFAVAIDNTGEIAERFGEVKLTPTSVLINRRGEVVKRYVGEPDFAALQTLIERLLAET